MWLSTYSRGMIIGAMLIAPAAVLAQSAAPAESSPLARCTVVGTSGPDRLVGTAGDDYLCGLEGDDVLLGRGGNDRFDAGPGLDVTRGGPGDDRDRWSLGADSFHGGSGFDRITYQHVGPVSVALDGLPEDGLPGEGDNILPSVEAVTGSPAGDVLIGSRHRNVLAGIGGDDVVRGGRGADRLLGGGGRDDLFGQLGRDVLTGGASGDALNGGGGADSVDGGTSQSPYQDVCQDDDADALVHCLADNGPPTVAYTSFYGGSHGGFNEDVHLTQPLEHIELRAFALDVAGVRKVEVQLIRAGDNATLDVCPTAHMGSVIEEQYLLESNWRWGCTLPFDMQSGAYVLRTVAIDRLGNRTALGPLGPGDNHFVILDGDEDAVAPTAEVVEVPDRPLAPGEDFWISVKAADVSGVVWFTGLAQDPLVADPRDWCSWAEKYNYLQDGTVLDGTWRLRCTVPEVVRNSTYTMSAIGTDGHRNVGVPGPDGPSITVAGGVDDTTAPELRNLTVSSRALRPGDHFAVTADIIDDTEVGYAEFFVREFGSHDNMCDLPAHVSGTRQERTVRARCIVPDTSAPGDYPLTAVVTDRFDLTTYVDGGIITIVDAS